MPNFLISPLGKSWPSAGCSESALLAVSEAELERRLSWKLHRGVEDGLGHWAAIGLELASGAVVELINYQQRPGQSAFIVRTAATDSSEAVLAELLACLGLAQTSIIWRPGDGTA